MAYGTARRSLLNLSSSNVRILRRILQPFIRLVSSRVLQVRKRPLNKKEILKREDDVIDIEPGGSLLVHETKLKVGIFES